MTQTKHALDSIFTPESVAIIGASSNPTKRGHQALRALRDEGFAGSIQLVNPNGGTIEGMAVAPGIDSLDTTPDLAFVCTPAAVTPQIIEECGEAGIRAVVIVSGGFGESGEHGLALERRIRDIAHEHEILLVGPVFVRISDKKDNEIVTRYLWQPDARRFTFSQALPEGRYRIEVITSWDATAEQTFVIDAAHTRREFGLPLSRTQ